ncbi:receptor kinase-like protein Xa21 [Tripterygium wilfordii]|uniref:receptor kinase-like protein Xa21 n=1 Tax=Tripterygium wilfordii TaxID=458696 RepID=UPI0018F81FD3|nr:receptor kinase-like protein Xa21 [Tripterygium wilfordii]
MRPIPLVITNLTLLKTIIFSSNNLSGTIPEIGNLKRLQVLLLDSNRITGFIPSSIFNISTLQAIHLAFNDLSGRLPASTGLWLPSLEYLALARNKLTGPIPTSISNASQLTVLTLAANAFSGFIPDSLGNLGNLKWLNLANNLLTTESSSTEMSFLSSLTNCKHLFRLIVCPNSLSGTLPISIGNLSASMRYFYAHGCNIKGSIPSEIGKLTNLAWLDLAENELTGTIPTSIRTLPEIQLLNLSNNKLQGAIPIELCGLEKVFELSLGFNQLSGPIPQCLGNLKSLRKLSLSFNSLTGTIPSTLWRLRDILFLNLSGNSLNGTLSPDIQNLKVVVQVDLSNNYLSGDMPNSFAPLTALEHLSLSNNRLQGHIPQSFGNLISLEFLDLSNNSLSGEIPKSLEKLLYLKYLNMSFNRLEGVIPNGGPFPNSSIQSFIGNKAICGAPRLQLPPCKPSSTKRSRKVVLVYILTITASTLLVLVILLLFSRYRKNKRKPPVADEGVLALTTWRRTFYHELVLATDGFGESNLIGRGSYGSVYKGILANGINVAVKVFNSELEGAYPSFESECEVISNIRHRNLVKVISCCSNPLHDFKAILLDYMPNGSLEKWLHSDTHHLDILKRLEIVIDVASALEYLHYGYSTTIVHCDIKPSNVLLDENMVGHLSDFGIAKLLGEGQSMTLTQTLATIGYMAPEYGSGGHISGKGDVYSYGILLMETITSKKPTDEMFSGDMSLKQLVGDSLLNGSVTEIVDSDLLHQNDLHFAAKKQCAASILSLAINCTTNLPVERINMEEVGSRLEKIKSALLASIERRSRYLPRVGVNQVHALKVLVE